MFTHLIWRMKGWLVQAESVPEGGILVDDESIAQYAFPSALRVYHEAALEFLRQLA